MPAAFAIFTGANSFVQLGGNFSGDYPKAMRYSNVSYDSNGPSPDESSIIRSGTFVLERALTAKLNEANDDQDGAEQAANDYLTQKGYVYDSSLITSN